MSKNLVEHPEMSEDNSQEDATLELELAVFISKFKTGIWLLGIPVWIFGIADKSLDAFANGYLSSVEFFHLLTTSLFFVSWLYLKPDIKRSPISGKFMPNAN